MQGAIAVVARGGCGFSDKTHHMQQAGAIAVIIVNIEDEGQFLNAVGDGRGGAKQPTIPTVLITRESGRRLQRALLQHAHHPSPLVATLGLQPVPLVATPSPEKTNEESGDQAKLDDCDVGYEGCKDIHKLCPRWASTGECAKNPNYMLHQCQGSCEVCRIKRDACKAQLNAARARAVGEGTGQGLSDKAKMPGKGAADKTSARVDGKTGGEGEARGEGDKHSGKVDGEGKGRGSEGRKGGGDKSCDGGSESDQQGGNPSSVQDRRKALKKDRERQQEAEAGRGGALPNKGQKHTPERSRHVPPKKQAITSPTRLDLLIPLTSQKYLHTNLLTKGYDVNTMFEWMLENGQLLDLLLKGKGRCCFGTTSNGILEGKGTTSNGILEGQGTTSNGILEGKGTTSNGILEGKGTTSNGILEGKGTTSNGILEGKGTTSNGIFAAVSAGLLCVITVIDRDRDSDADRDTGTDALPQDAPLSGE
eukprot:gene18670-25188_t